VQLNLYLIKVNVEHKFPESNNLSNGICTLCFLHRQIRIMSWICNSSEQRMIVVKTRICF